MRATCPTPGSTIGAASRPPSQIAARPFQATVPRGGRCLRAGPNVAGADAAAGRRRRAGQREALEIGRTGVDGAAAAVCVAGAVVAVATQQSLMTTGALTTVVQPQLVRQ